MFIKLLQGVVQNSYRKSCIRCTDWSGERVARLKPKTLLDVGCNDGRFLLNYLNYEPEKFYGIEAVPALIAKARANGLIVEAVDLNGRWPYPDNTFEVIHCAQVIEHLHNTRMFVEETFRTLKPGGTAIITSENLTSFLNLGAMLFGYTPFSLMRICGWYLGNPFGLHYQEGLPEGEEVVPIDDPAYAGVTGHVRVLSVIQAAEFFKKIGFQAKVSSLGLMPLPDGLGKLLEPIFHRRGHFLLIEATKPALR